MVLWKWIGSGAFVVLSEVAAGLNVAGAASGRCRPSVGRRSLACMAGGMSSGHGESLAQRIAETTSRTRGAPPPETHGPVPAIKHCWYSGPHGRQAALLLEWRKVGDGHDGRIAVAVPDSSGWGLVEMWVDAGLLGPGQL